MPLECTAQYTSPRVKPTSPTPKPTTRQLVSMGPTGVVERIGPVPPRAPTEAQRQRLGQDFKTLQIVDLLQTACQISAIGSTSINGT